MFRACSPCRSAFLALAQVPACLGLSALVAAPAAAIPCPSADCDPALFAPRTVFAAPLEGAPPRVDGSLDEPAWSAGEAFIAGAADRFIVSRPRPGAASALSSRALVLADAEALYVGLRYDDPTPETIVAPLLKRDDESASDWAFVEIDSRYDRRSAYSFGVNPRGVQVDGLWVGDTSYDFSWNGVWQAAARRTASGWTAEMRIPLALLAFRLPRNGDPLRFGINFYRYSAARGESSNWSPRFAGLGGIVSNFNDLRLPAPQRLRRFEATPYLAAGQGNDRLDAEEPLRAGVDLKAGLGENFQLTATLLPDFGQVEADPSQVNLRAFELFQAERRPFFLEGLDVFRLDTGLAFTTRDLSFAEESPFYSRRIGRAPRGFLPAGAELLQRPAATTILGAAKLSGVTSSGWTLGLFTALTDQEEARVRLPDGAISRVPVASREATTVARAIRSFAGGDGSFSLFLADLHRADAGELERQLVDESSAFGLELVRRFGAERNYELRAFLLGSRLAGSVAAIARSGRAPQHYFQRPDEADRLARYLEGESLGGGAGEARVAKIGGGGLRWELAARGVSPGFDVDELGFQRQSDWLLLSGKASYEVFRPGRPIRHWIAGLRNTGTGWSWDGDLRAAVFDLYATVDTRNFWSATLAAVSDQPSLSSDWLRGGPALLLPARTGYSLALASDSRRPTQGMLELAATFEPASGSRSRSISPYFNLRGSDFWQASLGVSWREDELGWHYAGSLPGGPEDPFATAYLVSRLRQETLAFTLRGELILSPRLALQAYLQPFASSGRRDRFQRLSAPRHADPARRFRPLAPGEASYDPAAGTLAIAGEVIELPAAAERSLDGSLVVRWEYHPGSFLTFAFTHQRAAASREAEAPEAALGELFGDRPINVALFKLSRRFGS